MYLRKSKKKNGRVYLTIVEAYRDERGKNMSRTRVLRYSRLDLAALPQLGGPFFCFD